MSTLHLNKIIPWFAVVVWMGVIFFLSHQPGNQSSDLSSGITDSIIHIIQTIFPFIPMDVDTFHHLIRKSAHFTAYFILGVLTLHALRVPYRKGAVIGLCICVLYAMTDEAHQLFIPGRSGEFRDVLIDSAGAATGIGVYIVCVFIFRRFIKQNGA